MGTVIKNPVPDRVERSFVIFDIRTLSPERQSARVSKIINDGLTRSGGGCFIVVPIWQQRASKGQSLSVSIAIVSFTRLIHIH